MHTPSNRSASSSVSLLRSFSSVLTLSGFLLLPSHLLQSQPAVPAAQNTDAEKKVPTTSEVSGDDSMVVLNPFVVSTERDEGFAAATALAGGRLATDLKDTPVAYSVINQEVIQALGLTDLTAAAEWTTNTYKFPDGAGGGDLFNITVPINVRGVGNISQLRQRNFFIYFSENDSYNIERFDFGRGPNQILFGNGTVGGTQVTMTKRARVDRAFETLEVSYGSWDNMRVVLDVNKPLNKKLAFRTSLLWADRDGWRDREMENRKAGFVTTTFKPFKNTDIRLEGELGRVERRIPDAKLTDRFDGWNGAYTASYLAALPANANAIGVNRNGGNYFVYNPVSGPGAVLGLTDWAITRGGGDTSTTPAGSYVQGSLPAWNQSNATILHAVNVAPDRFGRALANSKFFMPADEFTNAPDAPLITSKFHDVQLTVNQKLGGNLYLELAGDANKVESDINRIEGNAIQTFIDINPTLPGGATNPNFLRPYGDGIYSFSNQTTEARSIRAAAAYMLDLDKWGNYGFNIMGGLTNHIVKRRNRVLASGVTAGQLADYRQWATDGNALRQRFYWGDSGAFTPPTGPVTYINNLGVSSTISPTWVPWAGGADSSNNISDNENDYNYVLGGVNAKFFRGRLVLLGAMRYDDSQQQVRYLKRIGDFPRGAAWDLSTLYWREDAPADWASLLATRPRATNATSNGILEPTAASIGNRYGDDYNPPVVKAQVWTPSAGAVVHIVRDKLLVFGNYAEALSFNASAAPDVYGRLLPPVEAKGSDFGIRWILFDGKLNISAITYTNEEFGNYIDPTSVTNQINTLYQANPLGDTTTGGRNTRGAVDINGLVRDTRTRTSEGYEFEVVANLTKSWRVIANVGLPKVTEEGVGPYTRRYIDENGALFRQILDDAGGTVGPDGIAVRKTGVADTGNNGNEGVGNEAQRAVNAYNTLYANASNNLTIRPRKSLNVVKTVNIFTDYTFREGFLKNFKVGGGINYRSKRGVGYRGNDTVVNPSNPSATIDDPGVDAFTPLYAPGATLVTFTTGYTWKFKNRRELSLNLRISNLLDEDDVIWTDNTSTLRPRGGDLTSPARETVYVPYAYQTPRNYYLTAKLTF